MEMQNAFCYFIELLENTHKEVQDQQLTVTVISFHVPVTQVIQNYELADEKVYSFEKK